MTVRLTIDERAWSAHVAAVVDAEPTLVPVVKGNGYGFGRPALMSHAAAFAAEIAVGTVYEAADTPADRTAVVLTPTLRLPPAGLADRTLLTVGSRAHVQALADAGWRGGVVAKLASTMERYGAGPGELPGLLAAAAGAGLEVVAVSIHLPLAGDDETRSAQAIAWLDHLPPALPLWVSHLGPDSLARLREAAGDRPVRLRTGTQLWHGDKSMLRLAADVLDVRTAASGSVAGYRSTPVPGDGWLVLVGAGTAHGVAPLDDGRSPFHHRRRRVALLEPPHMHTSMLHLPRAEGPPPEPGDWFDLQRPLISTTVDELVWS